mgnify:CR=1 FL=1
MGKQTDKRIADKIETNNYINELIGDKKILKSELAEVKAESERRRLAIQELLLQSLENGKKIERLEAGMRETQRLAVKFIKES